MVALTVRGLPWGGSGETDKESKDLIKACAAQYNRKQLLSNASALHLRLFSRYFHPLVSICVQRPSN